MALVLEPTIYDALSRGASRHGISLPLVAALANGESGFNPQIVAGNRYTIDELRELEAANPSDWWVQASVAVGLMQLHTMGVGNGMSVDELIDPAINADRGCGYLRACLDAAQSDRGAISAYNQGIGGWQQNGELDEQTSWISAVLATRDRYAAEGILRRGASPPPDTGNQGPPLPPPDDTPSPPPPVAVDIRGTVEGIIDTLTQSIDTAVRWLREHGGSLGKSLADTLDGLSSGFARAIRQSIADTDATLTSISKTIADAIKAGLAAANEGVSRSSSTIARNIISLIQSSHNTLAGILSPLASKTKDGLDLAHSALDATIAGISTTFDSVYDGLTTMRDDFTIMVNGALDKVSNTIDSILTKSKDWYMQTVSDAEQSLSAARDGVRNAATGVVDGITAAFDTLDATLSPIFLRLAQDIGQWLWRSLLETVVDSDVIAAIVGQVQVPQPSGGG